MEKEKFANIRFAIVESHLQIKENPKASRRCDGQSLSFHLYLLALGFKRISFLSWLHFIIKWLNAFSRWHGIFHVYLFIYLIIIYTQLKKKKNSSGTKNSNTITNILRTEDHNPNITWTNTNTPLKNLISMNAVSESYDREGV